MYFEEEREMKNYDIVIIGGGPAGLAAAIAARKNGTESILILERDDRSGICRKIYRTDRETSDRIQITYYGYGHQ